MSKIIEALKKLDVSDDGHWTSDGLPRLEIVAELTKQKNITRHEIGEVAPFFTRGEPRFEKEENVVEEVYPTADVEIQPKDELSDIEEQIQEAENKLKLSEIEFLKAQKMKEEAEAVRDALLIKIAKTENPHQNQIDIMTYLAGQQRLREHRASILNPSVQGKSVIDQALAFKAKPKRPGINRV